MAIKRFRRAVFKSTAGIPSDDANAATIRPTWQQIKLLPKILSRPETYWVLALTIILVVSLGTLGFRWYLRHTELAPKVGGEYSEGIVGSPRAINPVYASANEVDISLTELLFAGLFRASGRELVSDLAESYTISDDDKTYQITIRPNLKWSDGEPLTIDDVIFTINAIKDPAVKSTLADQFRRVVASKVDDHTVKLELSETYSPFLTLLTFGILPEHIWQNVQPTNFLLADFNLKPIGNGPYVFKSFTKDRQGGLRNYILEQNTNYHGFKPYLQKITFKFYPDMETGLQALQDGNIDGLGGLPRGSKSKVNLRRYNLYQFTLPQYTAIFFNPQANEILKNKSIRRALVIGLNRPDIIDQALAGQGKLVDGAIPEGALGYTEEIKKYAFDPGWAGELLEQAGWKKAADGFRYKGENKLALTLTIPERDEYIQVGNMIRDYWNGLGIETTLQVVPTFSLQSEIINPRQYQALVASEIMGIDPDPYPFWHSSQNVAPGLSLSLFINENMDKFLERARQTVESSLRAKEYADFQNVLAEEIYAIFLYSPVYQYVLHKDIKGLDITDISQPADRLTDITSWYRLTERRFK